ncbi:MAG: hypothetical protein KKB59_04780, partial [Spirochaetes bacterium]|nr:hypothetical protein [Spirochaetota bacterium]
GALALAGGVAWCCVYLAGAAGAVTAVSDYGGFGLMEFLRALKRSWMTGLAAAAGAVALTLIASAAIPFYLSFRNMPGFLAAALLFWVIAATALAAQFFLSVSARVDRRPSRAVKLCFLMLLESPGFCALAALQSLALLGLSLFLAFLLPGPGAVLLFLDEAVRLRVLRDEWLAAHPEADRRRTPWGEILAEERERTGTRSLRNFLFPWKRD